MKLGKPTLIPKYDDMRIRTKFIWWPRLVYIHLNSQVKVWLEKTYIVERYRGHGKRSSNWWVDQINFSSYQAAFEYIKSCNKNVPSSVSTIVYGMGNIASSIGGFGGMGSGAGISGSAAALHQYNNQQMTLYNNQQMTLLNGSTVSPPFPIPKIKKKP